ncbi:MAG TPA: hypothetical protein PL037_00185 [Elusimicrobiales bacterium]|nr:hypothetical protein [Elusimicrobiales bacterium]
MKVLFVCTGNMCRSPAAEKLLRHLGGPKFESRSRGTAAQAYTNMPGEVIEFLIQAGVKDLKHTPTLVMEQDVDWADVVLPMEEYHFDIVAERFPQSMRKMHLFLDFCTGSEGKGQRDPMGQGAAVFNQVLGEIKAAIEMLVNKK